MVASSSRPVRSSTGSSSSLILRNHNISNRSTIRVMRDSIDRHIDFWQHEVPDLDVEVEGVVTRMQMLVRHLQQRRAAALQELGLRSWEYDILWRLRAAGPPYSVTPTALAVALDTHPATLTNRLDRLTQAGLVARSRAATDRRSVVVVLTEAGHRAWESSIGSQAGAEQELLEPLST